MKLVYRDLETHIFFEENKIIVLLLEKQEFFTELIWNLQNQLRKDSNEELFVLSDGNEILNLDKSLELVIDPINLDLNSKKVLTHVYCNLSKMSNDEDYYLKTNQLIGGLTKLVDDLIFEQDLDLVHSEGINMADLFKIIELKINCNHVSLLVKLIDYINTAASVLQTKVIVFINLKAFLSTLELKGLYKEANLKKIYLFLIENKQSEPVEGYEKLIIVDQDLCEIH